MRSLRLPLILTGLLVLSGTAFAQNDDQAWYDMALGLGIGIDKVNLREGGSIGVSYLTGNLRFNFWQHDQDDNRRARRPSRIKGFLEAEVGYWSDSELRPFTRDLVLGINALAVASAGSADVFFGAGFGGHFLHDATGASEDTTKLGANLQFGIDLNFTSQMAFFGLGRYDILSGDVYDLQTKILGGVRVKF